MHFIMIKGLIQEEGITLINIYTPNTGAPKHINIKNVSNSNNGKNNIFEYILINSLDVNYMLIYFFYPHPVYLIVLFSH